MEFSQNPQTLNPYKVHSTKLLTAEVLGHALEVLEGNLASLVIVEEAESLNPGFRGLGYNTRT